MKKTYLLPLILAIDTLLLVYQAYILSLSYSEVHIFYGYYGIIGILTHIFTPIFGINDFSVRLPLIILHLFSIVLFYKLTFFYLQKESYRIISTTIFLLLPGVMSSAILINNAGFVLFATLLFLFLFKKYGNSIVIYSILGVYTFLDNSFGYLFLALLFYGLQKKDIEFVFFNFVLILINILIFGTDVGGYPTGHFLDALGVYAAIFSPLIFIYLCYALYREYIMKHTDITWFIATVPLLFSLILSLRQRVHVEYYAPFVIVGVLIAVKVFSSSYMVRLPVFRKRYKVLFSIIFGFLVVHFFIIIFNKELYLFMDKPKHHFAYDNQIAKELSKNLRKNGIRCIDTNYKMQLRLQFYDIATCKKYQLSSFPTKNSIDVTVRYKNKDLYKAYVTKINS